MQHHPRDSAAARSIRIAMLVCAFTAISGCALTEPVTQVPPDYHLSYNLPFQDRATLSRPVVDAQLQDLSAKIYLISDNQRHEVLGGGANWFRNALSDVLTKVAIRPPQLDLFGQDLLREALAMIDGFVLHLGDACDVSNTGEFGRFAWDMRLARNGWVMAPGNHDGFFYGNSSRTQPKLIQEWNEAGESYDINGTRFRSQAMQKDRFVSYYLAALILQDELWSEPLARELGVERYLSDWSQRSRAEEPVTFGEFWATLVALENEIYAAATAEPYSYFELTGSASPLDGPHLRRIAWHIDKEKVWQSFILQEVDISVPSTPAGSGAERTSILVFDTAHYGVQPSLDHGIISGLAHKLTFGTVDFQVAGEHGNILPAQELAAKEFARAMRAEGRRWILATHHPYDSLGRATPARFNDVRDAGGVPVTLSAHTHSGEIRLNLDTKRNDHFLEINVGSLLDSPVEFRDFQLHRLDDRLTVSSKRMALEDLLRERGLVADEYPGYRASPGDPDYYLAYREKTDFNHDKTDFKVKQVVLAAYLRMFRVFETDDPDQRTTYWPMGPGGERLGSHQAVVDAIASTLGTVQITEIDALNRFLYELQEFDRTRGLTDASQERLRIYRISQSIWASRAELRVYKGGTTAIDPEISFLILPTRTESLPAR